MRLRLRAWLDELTFRQRLLGLFAIAVAGLLATSFWETSRARSAQAEYESVAASHLSVRQSLRRLQRYYGYHFAVEWSQQVSKGRLTPEQALADLRRRRSVAEADWADASRLAGTIPDLQQTFDQLRVLRAPADRAVEQLAEILAADDQVALMNFFAFELDPATMPLLRSLEEAGNRVNDLEGVELAGARMRLQRNELASYGVAAVACLLLFFVARAGFRDLYRGIEILTGVARRVSAGDFTARPERIPQGEFGELARAFVTMQDALARHVHELHEREVEARAASQSKSMFLAAMSHEIRTPLIGVIGMLEVLGRSRLQAEQRRQFNIVQHSAHSLLGIVGDILDYSKIEAGKVELTSEPVAIRDLVSRVVSAFSATVESKGLQITQCIAAGVAPAHIADGVRLMQILANFINNAIKFTQEGSIAVAVAVVSEHDVAQRLSFSVSDTGIGMSPEQLARLFRPFTQADAGTTRRFGGTGLGLVITRRLAELMGGTVSAVSELGRGTVMTLEVSLSIGNARDIAAIVKEREAPVATRARPTRAQAEAEGSLLLLAEDHPVNREVLTGQLNLAGFAVDVAEDGLRALERFTSGKYALVLTDLHMPGLDGFQLTAAIREFERVKERPRTPILALTADVIREHVERTFESGMDDYLSKPVTIRQLVEKLRHWLPHLEWKPATPGPAEERRAPARASPLEGSALDQFSGGDPAKALQLLRFYCKTTADDLVALEQALLAKNGVSDVAHRMKGAALMVGAHEIAELARELEADSRKSPAADFAAAALTLQQAVARVERHAEALDAAALGPVAPGEERGGARTPVDL